jgi:2-polyprenyl-6-methoxyphenol hydroxylase-like FAD-dependent oxidoreductase
MPHYDIAIVGMGPVGCTAALFLANAGLKVAAIERDPEVYALPRAVAMDGEIIRAYQGLDLGQAIADLMQPNLEDYRAGFANSKREWLFGTPIPDFSNNAWPPLSLFDQPELDGFLRNSALNHDNVSAYIGYEYLYSQEQSDSLGISLREVDSDSDCNNEKTLSATYLLACDGASSGIRRSLNIAWEDLGYDHDWLVVDVIAKDGNTLNRETLQVCAPERLTTYVCAKDPYRRWEFALKDDETAEYMLQEETIHSLIDPWTPRGTYQIRRSAVYQFHAAIAQQWSQGRIFLLGDAAHQTPPFLGQGMNAGMRDAINISWKLALVLAGEADSNLLQEYQAERAPHARDLVQWAVDFGRLMEGLAASEDAENKGLPPPPTVENTSSGYGQGREAPPIRGGVVMLDQVSDEGSTGYLFSQPLVKTAEHQSLRMDELLGDGFAIVARSGSDLVFNQESQTLISQLGITTLSLDKLSTTKGHFDRLFESSSAALIRPDRYVFGHTTEQLNLDQLLQQLGQKLHLNPHSSTTA